MSADDRATETTGRAAQAARCRCRATTDGDEWRSWSMSGQSQATRHERIASCAAPSRRRILTILGGMAGLPLLLAGDAVRDRTPLVRWRGTALGSPACIVVEHPDAETRRRVLARCAAEIERLEKVF